MKIISAKTDAHLQGILDLQQANLPKHISAEESRSQGFVTVEHDMDILSRMNDPHPHIIAVEDDRVVGYCLTMLTEFRHEIPVIAPMFDMIDYVMESDRECRDKTYFAMGQVCVAKSHRGRGVFYQLYDAMGEQMSPHFDMIITEISDHNKRSMRAHEKQGFKIMHSYSAPDGHPWHVVYWDWS